MNTITLNGVTSTTITGLLIQELPPISMPARRIQTETIDGRDGDINTFLGYEPTDKPVKIGLSWNYDINAVIGFFGNNPSGTVTFSNEPDKEYRYEINDQIDFERLVRFREATITLHCQPYKYPNSLEPIEDEVENIIDTTPYLYRISADGQNIGSQEFDEIVGGTIAWNQLFDDTYSVSLDVANNLRTRSQAFPNGSSVTTGHKYLYRLTISASENLAHTGSASLYTRVSGTGTIINQISFMADDEYYKIFASSYDATSDGVHTNLDGALWLYCALSTSDTSGKATISQVNLIDLTLMFGSTIADYIYSLETANTGDGVAYFKSLFPNNYYAYDSGTLMSVQTSEHKMVGKNLIRTDDDNNFNTSIQKWGASDSTLRDRINALFVGTYTCSLKFRIDTITGSATNGNYGIMFRFNNGSNVDKRVRVDLDNIETLTEYSVSASFEITSDIVGKCTSAYFYTGRSTTSSADYVTFYDFQLERGNTATPYEPYTVHSYPLDSSLTLRGIPKLIDNKLSYDGDIYSSDGTITRLYEQRAYQSGDESLVDAITDGTYTVVKLATPTTETATPFTNPQIVAKGGTEEYVDTRDVAIPVGHNTRYPSDVDITVNNVGNAPSKPIITIYGSGIVNLYINGNQMLQLNMGNYDYITIDTEAQNAYCGGVLANRNVTGDYSKIILPVGVSHVSTDGDVSQVIISNYVRWY